MGCGHTKAMRNKNRVHVIAAKSTDMGDQMDTKSNDTKEIIASLKEFRIAHTDFISERSGKISEEYKILLPPIGKGALSEVRRAIHRATGQLRAIKIIQLDPFTPEEQNAIKNEINILKKLDHPNMLKIYEFYQGSHHLYIVSELYTGGPVYSKISDCVVYNEALAAQKIRQILSALAYCHQNRIVHGDIRPRNILYESKRSDAPLKIMHFRISKVLTNETKFNPELAISEYTAPEVVRGQRYTAKCDVWSSGVILYVLLSGRLPPPIPRNKKSLPKSTNLFEHSDWDLVSEDAKALLSKMLNPDPRSRCTSENALNHPWIKKHTTKRGVGQTLALTGLNNLKKFKAQTKLQEAVWIFLVTFLATKEEKNKSLRTFQELDINGDGQLTREELIKGYQRSLNCLDVEEEVDSIFSAIDHNKNGTIDYTEFLMANISKADLLSDQRLQLAFEMIDKDGSGYITADELQEVFSNGKQVQENVWVDLIKEVDKNSDGKVNVFGAYSL